ncbi:hypothetical protein Taro_003401 [Colocasia esculenta]|uniref:Uncharacterized protein n=1 Tax=Colocasia esculenta TaxID=4460 RepID=A0A843TRT5_COLES|nr:hypothetical protein [Colocasia esculenta]
MALPRVQPSDSERDRLIYRVQIRRRHPGHRDLVATGWPSPSGSEGDVPVVAFRSPGVPGSRAVPYVPALADGPSGGFSEWVPCVPMLAGLVLVTSQLCHFCGGFPASSLLARCLALEGLSHSGVQLPCKVRVPVVGKLQLFLCRMRGSRAMPYVPALADGPSGGFSKGVSCVPVPAGLVLVTSQLCRFCGGCPTSSLLARCLALEGLSRSERLLPLPGTPILGSLLREYSRLRVCSSRQPTERTLELRGKRCLEFLAQTRQSFVSLPRSTLVPELRREVRCEAAAWPGYGVAYVVCFCGGSISPFTGVEAEARLASRVCGLRVPLLANSSGGLVAVVVMTLPTMFISVNCCPSVHGGYSLAVSSFCGRRWSGLMHTRASGGFRFGVLSAS